MQTKRIMFFADIDDIKPLVEHFELHNNVKYQEAGLFDSSKIVTLDSLFEIPNFGLVNNGDWNHNFDLLVSLKEDLLKIREVPQRKGGVKYALDQTTNEKAIRIRLGGVFNTNILVAWSIDLNSSNPTSDKLFTSLASLIRKKISKVGAFYVGNNAKTNLLSGWRLVTNDKSPKEYDLSINLAK